MRRLNKRQLKEREQVVANLRAAESIVHKAIETFNEAKNTAWAKHIEPKLEALSGAINNYLSAVNTAEDDLNEATEDYETACQDASSWSDDLYEEMDSYFCERTERWQDGEKGQAYQKWASSYSDLDCGTPNDLDDTPTLAIPEFDEPEDLDEPDLDLADKIEELGEEPE